MTTSKDHSYRRVFPKNFHFVFAQFFNLLDFLEIFFSKDVKFNKPDFLLLENFTDSDKTPPYLNT